MGVRKVNAYRTSDGKIFETKAVAEQHELDTKIGSQLTEFFKDIGPTKTVVSHCLDYIDELRRIVNDKQPPRKKARTNGTKPQKSA